MWFFRSPEIVYGDDALSHLESLPSTRALIVTDPTLFKLGLAEQVAGHLRTAGAEVHFFSQVEAEPSLQTVYQGADLARVLQPDLIVAVGGGSAMDAAKAILALYQDAEIDLEGLTPWVPLVIDKARLVAVPTTSGTGSETTWAIVLTDTQNKRKIAAGHSSLIPALALIDPALTRHLPPTITADTGMDVLTHAVEGYTATWHNDFCDGLCLKAVQLVFDFLPRAVAGGAGDMAARERMGNAAAIAGLGFGNSNAALAHAMGHSLGAYFKKPHGRVVGLFLPYTMEYCLHGADPCRYVDLARVAGLTNTQDGLEGGKLLVAATRSLAQAIGQPTCVADLGIDPIEFGAALETLCDHAESDPSIAFGQRIPDTDDLRRLFEYAYAGKPVDF